MTQSDKNMGQNGTREPRIAEILMNLKDGVTIAPLKRMSAYRKAAMCIGVKIKTHRVENGCMEVRIGGVDNGVRLQPRHEILKQMKIGDSFTVTRNKAEAFRDAARKLKMTLKAEKQQDGQIRIWKITE